VNPFRNRIAASAAALTVTLGAISAMAEPNCMAITAPKLEIAVVSCAQVSPELQASRQFPDVFAGVGKLLGLCYVSTGPAPATIGNTPVTITSTVSAWTSDFFPILFPGGTDNLGTVVTQLTIADLRGNSVGKLFTRDTIDLSQIASGTASEEDVIVGGTGPLQNAKGTYRIASVPEDQQASKVLLTNLSGVVCIDGQ
jgi:hypothetical protein